ncbi:HGL182Wp [Eremothecium sinecaudum]|uniref:HGL182Wp n=1 Tax=Eremothecium sinecaudum TaxID=45286 RepID=A0A109V0C6_9SACH|nr:HGL182Wp [Eremothecium sinecaudum]AMD22158.1 HGL182Wp [Eremothecium sinecaudum]
MPANGLKVSHFDDLEQHKENILPMREGRSAKRLSEAFQQPSGELAEIRLSYEKRLMDELDELDDPLELYLSYISWINTAYPQGATNKQSGMLDVMERCLNYFSNFDTYKNDPRYVKLWMSYIEMFAHSLQEKKDIFVHLLRKQIGEKLAMFYDDFAHVLFQRREYSSAIAVLKRGIEYNARPVQRVRKTLLLFEEKIGDDGVRYDDARHLEDIFASASKVILGKKNSELLQAKPIPVRPSSSNGKVQVFKDENSDEPNGIDLKQSSWITLDSKVRREQENHIQAVPLKPGTKTEKLAQEVVDNHMIGKIPTYQDSIGKSGPVYKILEQPGRKPEKIDCNFDLIYPFHGQEFCFEELLAIARKVYHKQPEINDASTGDSKQPLMKKRRKAILQEKKESPLTSPSIASVSTPRPQEYKKITTTSILPLRDENIDDNTNYSEVRARSPTVTMFSKDAMKEVYSMFNQNYTGPKPPTENDDTTTRFTVFENFTEEFTRKNMDDLTEVKVNDQERTPKKEDLIVAKEMQQGKSTTTPTYKNTLQDYMTPIQERTESAFKAAGSQDEVTKIKRRQSDALSINTAESSPFLTQPEVFLTTPKYIINDPISNELRAQLLQSIQPALQTYSDYYQYSQSLKMSALLKRIHKVTKNANKNPIVDFKKTNDLYCIRAELGEGGYATVYLAESSTGELRALKVEKPASVWEFYILKQVEKRLAKAPILKSIINVSALHCFQDESYLVLNYANQGTILDLINLEKQRTGGTLDECLCMFITVELMKVIECIHEVGIIHGDVKPDNCMIRFEECRSLGDYTPLGDNGWSNKGIFLIDFGRSFDLSLFQIGTKFKANWPTDQQDCPEMREGRPWSYEADYYGLAGIIHAMLFGKYVETTKTSDGRYFLTNSLKRYWKRDIWAPIFDMLLNSGCHAERLPLNAALKEQRSLIENYLERETSTKLRNMILSLESELTRFKQ